MMLSRISILCFIYVAHIHIAYTQICRIDLGIILDESGSIKQWGFDQEKKFVADIARQLTVSSTNTRVSVMTFSTHARMRIYFRDAAGQNWNHLYYGLRRIGWGGGWTYTHKALDLARNHMFNTAYGSRSGAPKMLLLLTDGKSQSHFNTLSYSATMLKNNFVNIMTIGIGRDPKRSELELIASRPIQSHVFQVADAYALNRIVNTVRTEACKPITCWFIDCIYHEWSAWSGTCHTVRRVRNVKQQIRKSKMVVGGCAGLNVLNCKQKVETKNLGGCLKTCPYVKCNWAAWGAWSATCGAASRRRQIQATRSTTQRRNCRGLPQRCYQKPQGEGRVTKCPCKYVECQRDSWSQWSTTCGSGQRSRNIQTIHKTVQRNYCNGLPQSCPASPEIERRSTKCTCNYVECKYGAWSQWTTSCGKGERSRKMQTIRKTVQKGNCAGLKQTCPTAPEIQRRTEICTCNYVECQYGAWSKWTTSCGKGERSRKMQTIRKTVQRENCAGLKTTCPTAPEVQTRTEMCTCNYVECQYGAWSQWTTSCGKGERSRQMQTIRKTVQRENCAGLKTTCPTAPEVQTRTEMCTCNYVECQYGAWSKWTTSCGKGERSRQMQTIRKTVQKENCSGLKTTCPTAPEVQTRTEMCTCNYVECQYGAWSQWTTSCGKGERSRKMQTIRKTVQRENCAGLKTTCPTAPEVQTRTEMCTCNYVECQYGAWSQWTTSCGKGERSRQMQTIRKTVQRENCAGLKQICPTAPEIQSRTQNCKCNYVECKFSEWSEWAPKCGKNMSRKKTLQVIKKTVEKANCDGLKQKCTENKEIIETKSELCECDTFKCELEWSAWSATCGPAQRVLRFKKVPIKVKKDSCDQKDVECPTDTEIQKEDFFCVKTQPPVKTDGASDATCHVPYIRIGCYKANEATAKLFTTTIFEDKYNPSKSFSKEDYVQSTICNCAVSAKTEKFKTFALQNGGRCLAGKSFNEANTLLYTNQPCSFDDKDAFSVYKLA